MNNEIHDNHEHASTSLKVILLVFAIVLVGTLGYLVWQQNNEADTTDYSAPTTAKKTNSEENTEAITDETADWKTYTSSRDGYSLKYPGNWEYNEEGETQLSLELREKNKNYSIEGSDTYAIGISVFANSKNETAMQIANGRKVSLGTNVGTVTITELKIGSEDAVQISDYLQTATIMVKNGKQYWIVKPTFSEPNDTLISSVYKKLVTTFKFTN